MGDWGRRLLRGLLRLLWKLVILAFWIIVKVVHEVTGLLEAMLKRKLESP